MVGRGDWRAWLFHRRFILLQPTRLQIILITWLAQWLVFLAWLTISILCECKRTEGTVAGAGSIAAESIAPCSAAPNPEPIKEE